MTAGRRWVRDRCARAGLLAAFVVAGCQRARPASPPPAPASPPPAAEPRASADSELELPDVAGFKAGPAVRGAGFVRRAFTRGQTRLEVTLARLAMSPEDYARWTKTSRAAFPQATLALPAGDANGFYQCGDGPRPSCDLLVQLRAGVHLELRGAGTSSRADVDALARGLPLRAWANRRPD